MSFLVVYNPAAGGGQARAQREAVTRGFERHGLAAEFLTARDPDALQEMLDDASMAGRDGVVAAGGDGTVFHVLNALCRLPAERRPPLGILPVGTGNAFARDLGLQPGDWSKGLALLASGTTRRVDLVRVSTPDADFHFLNIIGLGFVVQAGAWAARLKRLGRAAYTLGALVAMVRMPRHDLRLMLDDAPWKGEALFAEVSNSRYTGTHFLIAPQARLDDGRVHLTLLRPLSRLRLLRLFPTIYQGRHVDYEEVVTASAERVRIESPTGLPLMVDGEFLGHTPADIRCLPGAMRVFGELENTP